MFGINIAFGQVTWTALQDFPQVGGRTGASAFAIGNTIYYATGLNDGTGPNSQNWAYDITTNSWSQKANTQFNPRWFAVAFSINGKGYLGSGNLAANRTDFPIASNDFYEYDPLTDVWTLRYAIGPTGRYGAVAFVIQNKGYVAFGANSTMANSPFSWVGQLVTTTYEFDPISYNWTLKSSGSTIPGTINSHAFVMDNKAYIAGGFIPGISAGISTQDGVTIRNTVEFNPVTSSWTNKADIPSNYGRHMGTSFTLLDRGYITGGHYESVGSIGSNCTTIYSCYNEQNIVKYNPYQNTWSIINSSIPLGKFARAASVSNCDFGFVTTGARSGKGGGYNHLNFRFEANLDDNYISGPSFVCSSFDGQFNLQLSTPGSITWTTSSNLYIVSGQGTKNLNVRSNSNGPAWVQASIFNGCRSIVFPQKSTYSGQYSSSNYPVSGPSTACPNQFVYYSTNNLPNATNFHWIWPSNWTYVSGQGTAYLALYTGNSTGVVGVRVDNNCGIGGSMATKLTYINSCGSFNFSVSPNPSTDYIQISPDESNLIDSDSDSEEPIEVILFDQGQQAVFRTKAERLDLRIPVSNLQNGYYYLNIYRKNKVAQKRIEIRK